MTQYDGKFSSVKASCGSFTQEEWTRDLTNALNMVTLDIHFLSPQSFRSHRHDGWYGEPGGDVALDLNVGLVERGSTAATTAIAGKLSFTNRSS